MFTQVFFKKQETTGGLDRPQSCTHRYHRGETDFERESLVSAAPYCSKFHILVLSAKTYRNAVLLRPVPSLNVSWTLPVKL
jgi:hypothetical protein